MAVLLLPHLCMADALPAETRAMRKSAEPKAPEVVLQAIVQTAAGFVIAQVKPAAETPSPRQPSLIPLGGAVRIDRELLEKKSNGKDNGDARI
ncbi:hypothetical protein AWL63_18670 [Sphingomonas panacis]|uniref:Uncharacterized protein n=1 Tax=Sphingomonas panacis TaxID=1560345 RepID=A0A1B3ZE14_9SPHN|nr:hypothetical protein [Sphingomonas panacis]AOH85660.1 hypothetical protein AWL63_18670 [Sphingomonas panacis]